LTSAYLSLPIAERRSRPSRVSWFRELTDKAPHRCVFHSVPDLTKAIKTYLGIHNDDPKPFVWTATPTAILEKINRCKAVLETVH
jgi:hypothetical protein